MKESSICEFCNNIFESNDKRYKYCSDKCKYYNNNKTYICINCNNEFDVHKSRNTPKFCGIKCRKEYGLIKKICRECGNDFKTSKKLNHGYCSNECRIARASTPYNCDYCGMEFIAPSKKLRDNKSGVFCSQECSQKGRTKGIYVKCEYCSKDVYKMQSDIIDAKYYYCNIECRAKHQSDKGSIMLICKYCKKEYKSKKSKKDISLYCSKECMDKYRSEFYVGENNPKYNQKKVNCSECGEEFTVKASKLLKQDRFYCSKDCQIKYIHNPINITEKQINGRKIFLEKAITNIKNTLTTPHIAINSILDNENINYKNEKHIKYYSLDIHIIDYNLAIEVNGDFWHCNPIKYIEPKYKQQNKVIRSDKAKHTYVKNKYRYEILYLWENDINKNKDMCKMLILHYIKNKGIIDNYHSFNYSINLNNELILNENIIVPFQDR